MVPDIPWLTLANLALKARTDNFPSDAYRCAQLTTAASDASLQIPAFLVVNLQSRPPEFDLHIHGKRTHCYHFHRSSPPACSSATDFLMTSTPRLHSSTSQLPHHGGHEHLETPSLWARSPCLDVIRSVASYPMPHVRRPAPVSSDSSGRLLCESTHSPPQRHVHGDIPSPVT